MIQTELLLHKVAEIAEKNIVSIKHNPVVHSAATLNDNPQNLSLRIIDLTGLVAIFTWIGFITTLKIHLTAIRPQNVDFNRQQI